nr:MAG TPA: hypothetical protein [Caudoviricetes sp.]
MDDTNKIVIETIAYREKYQASDVFDNLFAYEKKSFNGKENTTLFFVYGNKLKTYRLILFYVKLLILLRKNEVQAFSRLDTF